MLQKVLGINSDMYRKNYRKLILMRIVFNIRNQFKC